MKIGIIGSGISGLVAAWSLSQAGCQVTLFESQLALGMDAHSVSIELEDGSVRADVPSRMLNSLEWPTLFRLYQQLEVQVMPVEPSQSFSILGGARYLKLDVANRPQHVLKSILNGKSRRILAEARRLKVAGEQRLATEPRRDETLSQYLEQNGFTEEFKYEFLFPTLSSTVCTCSYQSLDQYPVEIIFQLLSHLTADQPLLKTKFGTSEVVQRLTRCLSDVRLGTRVSTVQTQKEGAVVNFAADENESHSESFDHVIVATQANHAADLVSAEHADVQRCLRAFVYEDIPVVVHTDRELMPPDQNEWSTFNMISDPANKKAMCSVWMNQFHADWDSTKDVFQTINPLQLPSSETVICNARLQRPVVTRDSYSLWRALNRFHEAADRKIWFAGSYASPGVPLLESGVISSLGIVQRLGFESALSQQSVAT